MTKIATDEEIEERLRKLKGFTQTLEQSNAASALPTEDKIKTSDDLINKINDEVYILF